MALRSRKQIDNIGERFRKLTDLSNDRALIQEYRQFRCERLPQILAAMFELLKGELCLLAARAKRTDTIIRKLRREHDMTLSTMGDVLGFRILCSSRSVQDRLIQGVSAALESRRIRNSCDEPLASGYRGFHLIGVVPQVIPGADQATRFSYEVQIRTYYQHLWATESESFGEQVKEGGGTDEQREYLLSLSKSIQQFESAHGDSDQIPMPVSAPNGGWSVIQFDKAKGQQVRQPMVFDDLPVALNYYQYLEDLFSGNLSQEIVLLGTPTLDAALAVTHLRYWMLHGRPTIPAAIRAETARPSA